MIGPVYVITDPAARLPVIEQARAAARGGAWAVQLRDKTASDDDLVVLVDALLPELESRGVRLIVNDRVSVVERSGAHGLHIGQGDGDPRAARDRIGPVRLLGLSVDNPAQARLVPDCVDYVGVGPVRATATKPDHATPLGMAGLARIIALVPKPAVAIGGLAPGDAAALRAAGAAGMAVVSAVTRAPDPQAATRALFTEWSQT
ncbi:MAG: thiamine phosphate synthase [Paracoccus sp. (in: a-proteobacteria)]|uniref:thiamine phosphate synthase n=1 Tax=Paracoccus sp. TaxID=267 RepID=UPI0026DEA72D|nr:thiamine phosphate synthase [Paracoccus sp. (in: a-proteobacteria)]MDO5611974.1 thiamine phosphate synthase [Paracoccus sp. (in: a-proteobacteria)]